jgi:transcriptional regulator with AAA-type ATPase domain
MKISRETIKQLKLYNWPGNIRELQHAIERAVIMSDSYELSPDEFMLNTPAKKADEKNLTYNLEEIEKAAIQNAIKKYQGNLSLAAKSWASAEVRCTGEWKNMGCRVGCSSQSFSELAQRIIIVISTKGEILECQITTTSFILLPTPIEQFYMLR